MVRIRHPHTPTSARAKFSLEHLEERDTPAILTVNSLVDTTDPGLSLTLRDALTLIANGGSLGRSLTTGEQSQIDTSSGGFGTNDTIKFTPDLTGQVELGGLLPPGQSVAGGLTIDANGPVALDGSLTVGGALNVTATSITINGPLSAGTLTLNSSGLLDIAAGATVTAANISASGQVVVNTGQLDANGDSGGQVSVSATNFQNSGSITADGLSGSGGTVQVAFTGAYVETVSGLIAADGGSAGSGGTVTIDGGTTGNLFSSGTQEAKGEAGGSISITGASIDLISATEDVSGTTGAGGQIHIQSGGDAEVNSTLTARGGAAGGAIDVVTDGTLTYSGAADASATSGPAGRLVLDPKNIVISSAPTGVFPQYNLIDPHPTSGGDFGATLQALSTGNVVVTNANDNFGGSKAGAVYLFNGQTGALISTLTGSNVNDSVGSDGVTVLSNGNYVVASSSWNGGMGAVTWGSGTTGISGTVSSTNSLVGSTGGGVNGDRVGLGGVNALSNGNYVVDSGNWNSFRGAVTWENGTSGVSGTISAANSLVGSNANDEVGVSVTVLSNGDYVVDSYLWNGSMGAVTWGSGTTGITGTVSSTNSLVGSTGGANGDRVGFGDITGLSNGNYLVDSFYWNGTRGAVTWGSGTTGITGNVSAANSLIGSNANDAVGGISGGGFFTSGVTALSNGNYVVASSSWNGNMGAVTWGNGATGISGAVSTTNSVVGSTAGDQVGSGRITSLSNSNYVVASPNWNGNMGAVTWESGTAGASGVVSSTNSLVGSHANDEVGSNFIRALSNGNYVVDSPSWNGNMGAVTWENGTGATSGTVSSANSLVGSTGGANGDRVGNTGITVLSNGNYVVGSYVWNGLLGAVTWGSGTTGVSGTVSSANSLVGSNTDDEVGIGGIAVLSNGNYVISSSTWNGNIGAVTWGSGTTGISGIISSTNSLVGSSPGDSVGSINLGGGLSTSGVTVLSNGNYAVASSFWNSNRGAVTWGNGTTGITGTVSITNSLVGSNPGDSVGLISTSGPFFTSGVTALSNGNYAVASSAWNGGAGAATWVNGSTGTTLDGNNQINAQNSLIGQSTNTGLGPIIEDKVNDTFLAGFTTENGGRVTAGLVDPNLLTFSRGQSQTVTVTPDFLTATLDTGTAVVLQASNDITVNSAITVNHPHGKGGDLTLDAGRSILLNAGITTDNGNLTLVANEQLANGVVDAQRDPGAAVIAAGSAPLNTGTGMLTVELRDGAGLTNSASGDITLNSISAAALNVTNSGPNAGRDLFTGNVAFTGTANLTAANVEIGGGTFDASAGNLTVTGNLKLSGGTLKAPATGPFDVSGNWTNNGGTFNADGGTVTLDGTGQKISGNTTFNNLTKTVTAADTLTFAAGSKQTVTDALSLQGTPGNLLSLQSSSPGSQWNIDPQGTRNIALVKVQDSNNVNATPIAASVSHDAGNNTNWIFAPVLTLSSPAPAATELAGIPVTATFSEDVTGFTEASLTTTNATVANFAAVSARTYTFDLIATVPGTVGVSVAPGAAQDSAGNLSTGAALQRQYTAAETVAPVAHISGLVYLDYQANGNPTGDAPLTGRTVFVDLNHDGTLDAGDPSAVTGADGTYTLPALPLGTYDVREILFGGDQLTTPGVQTVTLGPTGAAGVDFGNRLTASMLPIGMSPTVIPSPNPNAATAELRGLYETLLGRDPSASEVAMWAPLAANPLAEAQAIWDSAEHFGREVDAFYQMYLHRAADAASRANWIAALQAGMSEQAVALAILTSPEYQQLHLGNTDFVTALYHDVLGRDGSASEVAAAVAQLGAGLSRTALAQGFLTSPEAYTRTVDSLYVEFFQRPADPAGEAGWVNKLENGQLTLAQVAQQLLVSDEMLTNASKTVG